MRSGKERTGENLTAPSCCGCTLYSWCTRTTWPLGLGGLEKQPKSCSTALGRSFFQGQNKLIKLFTAPVIKPCCLGCIILGINLLQGELRLHNASCPSRRESVKDSLCSSAGRCSVPASPAGPRPSFSAKRHFHSTGAISPRDHRRQKLLAQDSEPENLLGLSRHEALAKKRKKKKKTKPCVTPERCCELSAVTAQSCTL